MNMFTQADTDKDGKLSRTEYEAMTTQMAGHTAEHARPAVQDATTLASFGEQDADGDGMVTKEELWGRDWRAETEHDSGKMNDN